MASSPLKRRTQNVVTIRGHKKILRVTLFFTWCIIYEFAHKVGRKRLKDHVKPLFAHLRLYVKNYHLFSSINFQTPTKQQQR
mgnify:FL=1